MFTRQFSVSGSNVSIVLIDSLQLLNIQYLGVKTYIETYCFYKDYYYTATEKFCSDWTPQRPLKHVGIQVIGCSLNWVGSLISPWRIKYMKVHNFDFPVSFFKFYKHIFEGFRMHGHSWNFVWMFYLLQFDITISHGNGVPALVMETGLSKSLIKILLIYSVCVESELP